ncbi:hypothetical protein b3_0225 [Synechococcus phage B3]|nr:hypothetical protein b3_0225 [Synechococcus phage B3]
MTISTEEYNQVMSLLLEDARKVYDNKINQAARAYYVIIIEPLEKKYGIKFRQGNCHYCFVINETNETIDYFDVNRYDEQDYVNRVYDDDNVDHEEVHYRSSLMKDLVPVFDMLNTQIFVRDQFGYFVP